MLDLIRRRVEYFYGVCNVMSAMPIYNYRRPAGASVRHPHAQIFASNVIPNMLIRELHHTERMYEQRGSCPFCDMIEHERTEQIRVLYDQDGFIAFTFYAARFPFEIWVLPTTHQSNFERIDAEQVAQLGTAMQYVIGQLDRTLHDPPLNFFIHTLPSTMHTSAHFHWHVEIAPRVATYGGFEMGSGIVIDVTSPEIAAQALRE